MAFRSNPSVLWREGMFLCPQHLQAFSRELGDRIHAASSIGAPGDWGLVSLEVDEQALERDTFRLVECTVVFPDGTLASVPSNATVPQRDFAEFFKDATLDVTLGLAAIRPGVGGLGENGSAEAARFRADSSTIFDENISSAERELDFKVLQLRLFFGDEDRSGFECVPLARLVRKGKPEAVSALSETYIPPILACKASHVLVREIDEVADLLLAQARDLASRIPQTAMLSSVEKGADVAAFVKLQAVNQCAPGLDVVRSVPELHPFHAYLRLVEAAGSLAIFGETRTVATLEPYRHDDLDACFHRVIDVVRELIPSDISVPYDSEPFREDPQQPGLLVAEVSRDWLSQERGFFVGIRVEERPDNFDQLALDGLKLVDQESFEDVLQGVVGGIPVERVRTPPLAFPKHDDRGKEIAYFRIASEAAPAKWANVEADRRLLIVRADPAVRAWEFALFVELRS
ncbi:MAG: type VI secretion system baseplate subunit TssK [Planctomycetota bacterium]